MTSILTPLGGTAANLITERTNHGAGMTANGKAVVCVRSQTGDNGAGRHAVTQYSIQHTVIKAE